MNDTEHSEQSEPLQEAAAVAPSEHQAAAVPGTGEMEGLMPVLEALLFAAGEPLSLEEMQAAVPEEERTAVEPALRLLERAYDDARGLQILRVAGGYRMATRSAFDRYIRALFRQRNRHRLGRAALETLAIVAYRQPVTGPEISEIRGKDSSAVLKGLLEKRLLRITGRKRVVGKPFLYGTTRQFLMHFGLNSLDDLPEMTEFEEMIAQRVALVEEVPLPDLPEVDEMESESDGAERIEVEGES
jgi:segregation and condensation protein B